MSGHEQKERDLIRTDIHAPSQIDPADYSFIDFFDTCMEDHAMVCVLSGQGAEGMNWMRQLIDDYTEKNRNSNVAYPGILNRCDHCGQHIRYVAIFQHTDGDYLSIGQNCAEETMNVPDKMTLKAKRAREAAKNASTLASAKKKFPEAVEILVSFSAGELPYHNDFIDDVAWRFRSRRSLSEKQAAAIVKTHNRQMEWAKEREEKKAAEIANSSPVIEGKVIIKGEVLSLKWQESFYGTTLKMLVRDERGFKVWGSVPAILEEDDVEKGDTVQFVANVTKSDDDETFGFYKRPTRAVKFD